MGSPEQVAFPRGKGVGGIPRSAASLFSSLACDPQCGRGGGIPHFSIVGAILLPGVFTTHAESVRYFQLERHDGRVLHLPFREIRDAANVASSLVQSACL